MEVLNPKTATEFCVLSWVKLGQIYKIFPLTVKYYCGRANGLRVYASLKSRLLPEITYSLASLSLFFCPNTYFLAVEPIGASRFTKSNWTRTPRFCVMTFTIQIYSTDLEHQYAFPQDKIIYITNETLILK